MYMCKYMFIMSSFASFYIYLSHKPSFVLLFFSLSKSQMAFSAIEDPYKFLGLVLLPQKN
jgi:hypothetical protein